METKLQAYFPILRSRKDILNEIHGSRKLLNIFNSWEGKYQEEFLDYCTGAKGVKMLYDFCIKALMNPEIYPERLEELISLLLRRKVKILKVLPNDNSRIADESSLVLMDFLVQLKDGSLANVEIQKIGYAFPGQRGACYSADLLLRQYSQTTSKTFSYRNISIVYTIVLLEKSTSEFHRFPNKCIHKFKQKSNTGLKINLLQEFVFVALDIFKENPHNKIIKNRLDGWLTFLISDKPEDIITLINKYPDFKPMYTQIYEICQNIEKVMGMFSKELYELDKNTVRYMIDELQDEIKQLKSSFNQQLTEKDAALAQSNSALAQSNSALEQTKSALQNALKEIAELKKR